MIVDLQSEVTEINKQKFLAELGKLLTFMYEEDRQAALAMYNKMFDETADEQGLLQLLVSPTRQAVVIARAYNAKERKLQVHSTAKEENLNEEYGIPDFVLAIDKIREEAAERNLVDELPAVDAEQFSLFDDEVLPLEEEAPAEEPAPVEEQEEEPTAPVAEEEAPAAEEEPAAVVDEVVETAEEATEEEAVPVEEEAAPAEEEAQESTETEEAPVVTEEAVQDAVDEFIAELNIEDLDAAEAEPSEEEAAAEEVVIDVEEVQERIEELVDEFIEHETVRKPKVFMLILYTLLAIPLTAIGVAVLLIPTIIFLALAVSVISAGSAVLVSAFSGFAVFADIMLLLGAALIILAIGLLFLWTFIWFIARPIVGLIHGVIALGGKWCYKEVPVV